MPFALVAALVAGGLFVTLRQTNNLFDHLEKPIIGKVSLIHILTVGGILYALALARSRNRGR